MKMILVLWRAWDKENFWVPMRNRNSDLRILLSDALLLSHRDSMVSEVSYEVHMIRVLHTVRINNVNSQQCLWIELRNRPRSSRCAQGNTGRWQWSAHTRVSSFSVAYRGHTTRHCTRASRGLIAVKPRKQIICNPRFEREIKLVRLKLNSDSQYFAIFYQLAKQQYQQS